MDWPEEKRVFELFIKARPDFAGRAIVKWERGANPPDILCLDHCGRRIGVELGEWLNQDQIHDAKKKEKVENSFLAAIGSEKVPPLGSIGMVWLELISSTLLSKGDRGQFRLEIYELLTKMDLCWCEREEQQDPQGYVHKDFSEFPCLRRYLKGIQFFPHSRIDTHPGDAWICFEDMGGGAFVAESAVKALLHLLRKKTEKYESLQADQRLDELYLVAYYDQAVLYNTPFHPLHLPYVAKLAARAVARNPGHFQRIYLFKATEPTLESFQIWPEK